MKKHIRIYLDAFGYDETDFIQCEISTLGEIAQDFHHIECRGMGGDPMGKKDRIENIMAVTRDAHIEYGDKKEYMSILFKIHRAFLRNNQVNFDEDYMNEKIKQYEKI